MLLTPFRCEITSVGIYVCVEEHANILNICPRPLSLCGLQVESIEMQILKCTYNFKYFTFTIESK